MTASEKLRALPAEGLVVTEAPGKGYVDAILLTPAQRDLIADCIALAEDVAQTDKPLWGTKDGVGFKLQDKLSRLEEAL